MSVRDEVARALAIADGFDRLADELAATPVSAHLSAAEAMRIAPGATTGAATVADRHTAGLAAASWDSPRWSQRCAELADPSSDTPSDDGADQPYRPGLWQVGQVEVPAVVEDVPTPRVPLVVPLLDAANLQVIAPGAAQRRGARPAARAAHPDPRVRTTGPARADRVRPARAGSRPRRSGAAARRPGLLGPTLTTRSRLEAALAELSAEVGRITGERLAGRFGSLRERDEAGVPRGEPWRLLVLLAWPALSDDAARALDAVAAQGPACGVSVLAVQDAAASPAAPVSALPRGERLTAAGDGRWTSSLTGSLVCRLAPPPPHPLVTAVATAVASAAARAAGRPLELSGLLPDEIWREDSAAGLRVPIGRGADGRVDLRFDDDTVHGLVGGQAGAGKSTLLLDVVYGLAARYSPDQLRLVLLDFKEGLEFAQFAPRPNDPFFLPHADAVGIDSDREYGVAVLRHVRAEMARRAAAMRAFGARDLRALRAADPSARRPRILFVVDEFQVMLTPLDAVSREAVAHLEVLARQGRAYGVHLLLASQTLSGIDALDGTAGKRGSIFGQFALRIALRTSSAESRVLLSATNEAAGALPGVGTAVVNRRNGHPTGNEIVRVALADQAVLAAVRKQISFATPPGTRPPRLFVGYEPIHLEVNPAFQGLRRPGGGDAEAPLALLGAPLDLEPAAVGVALSALPGRHLAVLGPLRREAVGAVQAAVRSVAAQLPAGKLRVDLLAASPDVAAAADTLADRLHSDGHAAAAHPVTRLRVLLRDAVDDVSRREEAALAGAPDPDGEPVRLPVLLALDAARASLEGKDPRSRRTGLDELRFVTKRGPARRVHLLGWWRSPARFLDDLGPLHRDDVGAWLSAGVPGSDLVSLAGNRPVVTSPGPNRAVLYDRHSLAQPRTVIPFAPLDGAAPAASHPDVPAQQEGADR